MIKAKVDAPAPAESRSLTAAERWEWAHTEPGVENAGDRAVLMVLVHHADSRTLRSWPSVPTIAAHAQLSRRRVQQALKRLAAKGIIAIDATPGSSSVYTLLPHQRHLPF